MTGLVGALLAVAGGGAAGAAIRLVLGRIRRGMRVRPGPLEVAGAIVSGMGFLLVGPSARLAPVLFAGFLLIGAGLVDAVHHRLPDALTLPSGPAAVVLVVATQAVAPGSGSVLRALLCGLVLFAVFGLVARVSPRSMGRGDVKLVPTLGILTGFLSVATTVVAVVLAFLLGALVAVAGLSLRRLSMGSALPFGPFLLAGTWCALAFPSLAAVVAA